MENVTFFTNDLQKEYALIQHADGSFTSMLKSTYDQQQAEQSTPILPPE